MDAPADIETGFQVLTSRSFTGVQCAMSLGFKSDEIRRTVKADGRVWVDRPGEPKPPRSPTP